MDMPLCSRFKKVAFLLSKHLKKTPRLNFLIVLTYSEDSFELTKQRQLSCCAMMCNFPKSTAENPSFLKHREVETFFHEFGHGKINNFLFNIFFDMNNKKKGGVDLVQKKKPTRNLPLEKHTHTLCNTDQRRKLGLYTFFSRLLFLFEMKTACQIEQF